MRTKIENFLRELDTEIDVLNYVDIDSIDYEYAFNSISDMIEDNNGFDIDIIYHSNAINFLAENDPSLKESLEIASEYGFEVHTLNSETLASLLASKLVREEFYELKDEINEFFEELSTLQNQTIMETKDIALYQIKVFKDIQKSGFNVVTCGNCGKVLLHRSDDTEIHCFCGAELDFCDCPDLWYEGAEENYV